MSSMSDRVSAFLTVQRPSRFCDDCIAESLKLIRKHDVKPKVQDASSVLGTTESFHRVLGVCSMCGKEKMVIQSVCRTMTLFDCNAALERRQCRQ